MYNLIEYSESIRRFRQYYRDEPILNDNNVIIGFPANGNNSNLFKIKEKITENT